MFISKVTSTDLDYRLDSGFYRPEYLEMTHKLIEMGAVTLNSLTKHIACGPFGGNAIADDLYAEHGVSFIRPINISASTFDDTSLVRAPKSLLIENKLKLYQGENLYFGRVGVPCVALIEGETSISPNIIIAQPDTKKTDPAYLYAFSASYYGIKQLQRQLKEVAQPTTSTDAVRELKVLSPVLDAQKYIGDKVRQAERLRAWAKELETSFTDALTNAVGESFEDRSTDKKYARAKGHEVSYTLNPGAFNEERLRVQRYLLEHNGKWIRELATISGNTTSDEHHNTPYIGLDAIQSNSCKLEPSTIEKSDITGTCRLLREGPVIAKLRPYLNKVTYIPSFLNGAAGSTELLCVTPLDNISGWYLYGLLKSELVLKQLRPLATGATHPRIDQYDIYNLVVPLLNNQKQLGELLEKAQKAYFYSGYLTQAAKFLVEVLIEGLLTEQQLIDAETALSKGDQNPDRTILERLKTDGLDGEGAPLFPDLDQLYQLLEEAADD